MELNLGIYIGRFCTLHNGHLNTISIALKEVDHLIIFISSAQEKDTWKNIFSCDERKQLIDYCLRHSDKISKNDLKKISYLYIDDTKTNEEWIDLVKTSIRSETNYLNIKDYKIIFYCGDKDLADYPSWFNCSIRSIPTGVSSTDIRRAYIKGYLGDKEAKCFVIENVPSATRSDLDIYFQKNPDKIHLWKNL